VLLTGHYHAIRCKHCNPFPCTRAPILDTFQCFATLWYCAIVSSTSATTRHFPACLAPCSAKHSPHARSSLSFVLLPPFVPYILPTLSLPFPAPAGPMLFPLCPCPACPRLGCVPVPLRSWCPPGTCPRTSSRGPSPPSRPLPWRTCECTPSRPLCPVSPLPACRSPLPAGRSPLPAGWSLLPAGRSPLPACRSLLPAASLHRRVTMIQCRLEHFMSTRPPRLGAMHMRNSRNQMRMRARNRPPRQ